MTFEQLLVLFTLFITFAVLFSLVYILVNRLSRIESQLIDASRKNDETRLLLETLFGRVKRLEEDDRGDSFKGADGLYSYEVYTKRREMEDLPVDELAPDVED